MYIRSMSVPTHDSFSYLSSIQSKTDIHSRKKTFYIKFKFPLYIAHSLFFYIYIFSIHIGLSVYKNWHIWKCESNYMRSICVEYTWRIYKKIVKIEILMSRFGSSHSILIQYIRIYRIQSFARILKRFIKIFIFMGLYRMNLVIYSFSCIVHS